MKRIRSSGDEVTLFPFLAVLICTMGSLIVLLVVVVQQAKASASRVAHERAEQKAAVDAESGAIETQLEELQWRIDILNSSRSQSAEEHDRQQAELSYLEDEIRQLRDRILRAAEEADQIAQLEASKAEFATDVTRKVQELREQLDYARESLAQARAGRANRQPSYALVPYEGANGTRRRPLFVECLADRIVLQPEGIELTSEDFAEPLTDDNPLAASLRAQREYLKDAAADDNETAYPLIVVRPDGAQSYAAARAAMQSWDTEFGYELIDADMKLAYPAADAALSKVVKAAVEESRLRRQMLQSIAPARFGRSTSPARLTASKTGGFVSKGGSNGSRSSSARAAGRGGGAGGWGQEGSGTGVSGRAASGSGARAASLPGGLGEGGDRGSVTGTGVGTGTGTGDGDSRLENRELAGEPFDVANGASGEGGRRSGGAGSSSGSDGNGGDNRFGDKGANGRFAAGANERQATAGSGAAAGSRSSQSAPGDASQDGAEGRYAAGSGQTPGGSGGTASGRSSQSGGSSGQAGAGSLGGAGGSAGGGQAGGGGGGNPYAADASVQPLANARGRDWGLPERSGEATGITRPISLACYPDRLVMFPENPVRGRPFELAVDGAMRDEMDELVARIWKRMENWGIAGVRMYWKPVLQVQVEAGAEDRFTELAALLEDSGIVVKRK